MLELMGLCVRSKHFIYSMTANNNLVWSRVTMETNVFISRPVKCPTISTGASRTFVPLILLSKHEIFFGTLLPGGIIKMHHCYLCNRHCFGPVGNEIEFIPIIKLENIRWRAVLTGGSQDQTTKWFSCRVSTLMNQRNLISFVILLHVNFPSRK